MNAQQNLIELLLEQATIDYQRYGVVDTATQMDLDAEGYILDNLERDIQERIKDFVA